MQDDEALARWLALREPADAAARAAGLTCAIADAVASRGPLRALDLATGTGSNIRYLMPHLGGEQRWLALDRSAALLERLPSRMSHWGEARGYRVTHEPGACVVRGSSLECRIETRRLDLAVLDSEEAFDGRRLVTASALLDLVSERWLRALAERCRAVGAAALFAITYNGRVACTPPDPDDPMVLERFNRHQRTDKGLGGPAAGPGAVEAGVGCFTDAGYRVRREPSDWTVEASETELQRELIDGWAGAASEIAPAAASAIARWRARRLAHVDAGRSRLVVGHDDVAAWLE
ncbi:MAG: class I SAM-dependent methyltransferase [Acidobacteria bacterium]|nr:class I SAM-dependent methyltransferase [Acidobacteriota bacterium]